MTTNGITQLLYLFDESFQGTDWESLLENLKAVTPANWGWVAPGGRRSIREIVQHVGSCKFMYHNQAFGDRTLTWEDPLAAGVGRLDDKTSAVARLRQSFVALDDSQLLDLRGHHSGKPKETRWIISMMIQHDVYHAGEINYIRALHQQNDG